MAIDDKYTILYIEDNPANLRLVSQLLSRRSDVRLLCADEPISGLKMAELHLPDLILLDINLPEMGGFEVLKKLRGNPLTHSIQVFAISANAMSDDIEKGIRAGFNEYITKPINISSLLLAIDRQLPGFQSNE